MSDVNLKATCRVDSVAQSGEESRAFLLLHGCRVRILQGTWTVLCVMKGTGLLIVHEHVLCMFFSYVLYLYL